MLAVLPSGFVTQPETRNITAMSPTNFLNIMFSSPPWSVTHYAAHETLSTPEVSQFPAVAKPT